MNKEWKNKYYTLHGRGVHLLWIGMVHGNRTIRLYASYIIQVGNSCQSNQISKQVYNQTKESNNGALNNAWEYEHIKQPSNRSIDERNKYNRWKMNQTDEKMHKRFTEII